ncbi:NADPH:quinone oxidoreductase family protein [Dactylosporangium sp. CA-233914]|uniref:NADPH:quinone oxidoreductase family protein n=1 Tax=Dactylosporangium sp. CA-233914 TaxID=3239934 RepID=UPI003D8CAB66
MIAYQVSRAGEPAAVLEPVERGVPEAAAGQIVVRVLASAVNFPDVLLCRGTYQVRPELPFTPGLEVCGTVVGCGPGTLGPAVGDRVVGTTLLPDGGFGEFAVMRADATFPAPPQLDDAQAAALFIGYQTGWFGLHRRARLQAGETLLVHAAAGGVGSAAVQLGKAAGARVIAVVGGGAKAEVATAMGADVVIDRRQDDFVQAVKDETAGHGADVVYDPVGGETYTRSTRCIAFEGRILVVGFASGQIQSAALNHALVKNYSILGLHWGLYADRQPAALGECHIQLSALVERGLIRPLVSERLSHEQLPHAVQRLADGHTVGRLVYQP